jgi:hypothetical protein
MVLNSIKKAFMLVAVAMALLSAVQSYADPVAQIIGAPTGLTNQANPIVSIAGDDVVAYRYKLDGGDYSDEFPVSTPISFSADVEILGESFVAGHTDLQDFLDERTDYIDSATFGNVLIDTPVVFLLNKKRVTLQAQNTLYIEGNSIDQIEVYMNDSPGIPGVIIDQSLVSGNGYITYRLTTDTPETDFIRIINHSAHTATFKVNLNNRLFGSDSDVLNEIQTMAPEYVNEPIERKVWRFIRDNRYHWYPISRWRWEFSSSAFFLNSVGFGLCGNSAAFYGQLMGSLGYETRMWFLNGLHTVAEVFVNGKWRLYDTDLQVYYYNYEREVAGVEELAANSDLITNPIDPIPDTLHWVDSSGVRHEYSTELAEVYSGTNKTILPWDYGIYYFNFIPNYLLKVQIPSGGYLEFPSVFSAPIHTSYDKDAPLYTNAKLTIPAGWAGVLSTPLVIHSIGYDGPHTLSVIGKDSAGNWQTVPTVGSWRTDSWPPITTAYQPYSTDPVTLKANERSTIYYKVQDSTHATEWLVYDGPVAISSSTVVNFFAVDLAGNHEGVKCYNALPVSNVTLRMDKSSPQIQGAVIKFTAAAAGGAGFYEYAFWLKNLKTGLWDAVQPYSGNAVWQWDTNGTNLGAYEIQVWAKNSGSLSLSEASKSVYCMINPPPVTGVSLTMDKSSPQIQGVVVTFTAAATGGSGSYEYKFWLKNPKTGLWSAVQAYSGNAVWQWNTSGADLGTYEIHVWARNAGSTATSEASKSVYCMINPPLVTGVSLTMDKSSPQVQGAVITFTAAAAGGSGSYEYKFWLKNPKTGLWSAVQAYSGNAVWQWDTSGTDLGTYEIQVWARSIGSTATSEASKSVYCMINPPF